MCIKTQSLATALLPKFAFDAGYDISLLRLIRNYQKNPNNKTYNDVQRFLEEQVRKNTRITQSLIDTRTPDTSYLARKKVHEKEKSRIVILYESSEYLPAATQGSGFQQFPDGSKYSLSWTGGAPLFNNGGALKTGCTWLSGGCACT